MTDEKQNQSPLEKFSGTARLFPLPNLVLFPHIFQPLHIYEPRYLKMLEDALTADRLIAMVTLQPDWEKEYEAAPAIYPIGCIGHIRTYQAMPDGTHNILLSGLKRVKILAELPLEKQYRMAEVDLCEDIYPTTGDAHRHEIKKQLLNQFNLIMPHLPEAREQLEQLIHEEIPLGVLSDIISYSIDLDTELLIKLLAEQNVDLRTEQLVEHLIKLNLARETENQVFPPEFSEN